MFIGESADLDTGGRKTAHDEQGRPIFRDGSDRVSDEEHDWHTACRLQIALGIVACSTGRRRDAARKRAEDYTRALAKSLGVGPE